MPRLGTLAVVFLLGAEPAPPAGTYVTHSETCPKCEFEDYLGDLHGSVDCGNPGDTAQSARRWRRCVQEALKSGGPFRAAQAGDGYDFPFDHVLGRQRDGAAVEVTYYPAAGGATNCYGTVFGRSCSSLTLGRSRLGRDELKCEGRTQLTALCSERDGYQDLYSAPRPIDELRCESHSGLRHGHCRTVDSSVAAEPGRIHLFRSDAGLVCDGKPDDMTCHETPPLSAEQAREEPSYGSPLGKVQAP